MEIRTGFESSGESQVLSCPCFKGLEEFIIAFTQKIIITFVMGEFLHCGEKKNSGAKSAKSVFGKNCAKVAIL